MRLDRASLVRWAAGFVLLLPVIALYACEYLGAKDATFTGFIQYDQPYYMADARAFFTGGFHLLYGNPYSPDPDTPRIYFQLHLFVLGLIQKITGCDPGVLYVVSGFFAGLVCVRVAIALYEQVAGLRTVAQWLGLVLFLWGGGVIALLGLAYQIAHGGDFHATVTGLFRFDPADGWWFLNLGRNLVYPVEAYYHALALGAVLMAMRGNFRGMLWLAFALSLSHPFTGFQFLLILFAWSAWEMGVAKNRAIPRAIPAMLLCLLAFHLGYNLVLLNLFAEHLVLYIQWSIAWSESAVTSIAADLLVGLLALWALVRSGWSLFATPANRLLGIWFLVSLGLVHHDLVAPPRQPIHFAHGYTWIPLFLLGVGPLIELLDYCTTRLGEIGRAGALGGVFLLGLSDNLAWFGLHGAMALAPRLGIDWIGEDGFRLTVADNQLLTWLNERPEPHDELLVTPDRDVTLVYLAMTYTDYRAWYSHYVVTPLINQRKREVAEFFQSGKIPAGWRGKTVFLILPKKEGTEFSMETSLPLAYANQTFDIRVMQIP
jgi:hypothetical protein